MSDMVLEGLPYLNYINKSIAVYEPLFNSKKKTFDFSVKLLNDCYVQEFNSENSDDNNINMVSACIQNSLLDAVTKFQDGCNAITTNEYINYRLYTINFCKFADKYILCTFYKNMNTIISEEKYSISKNFIEKSIDIVLVVSEDGRILYANEKAVNTYGYTYKELLNLNVFELRNDDIREYTREQLNQALQIGIQFETYHYKKDGSRLLVEVTSV